MIKIFSLNKLSQKKKRAPNMQKLVKNLLQAHSESSHADALAYIIDAVLERKGIVDDESENYYEAWDQMNEVVNKTVATSLSQAANLMAAELEKL